MSQRVAGSPSVPLVQFTFETASESTLLGEGEWMDCDLELDSGTTSNARRPGHRGYDTSSAPVPAVLGASRVQMHDAPANTDGQRMSAIARVHFGENRLHVSLDGLLADLKM